MFINQAYPRAKEVKQRTRYDRNGENEEDTEGSDPCDSSFCFVGELVLHIVCFEYTERIQETNCAKESGEGAEDGQVCSESVIVSRPAWS